MQAVLLALLGRTAPYLIVSLICFTGGVYVGFQVGAVHLAAAQKALLEQRLSDAEVAGAANEAAATALAKADAEGNSAEATVAAANKLSNAKVASVTGQIAAQSMRPGQDAPDAPVLAYTLDVLGGPQ